MTDSEAKFSEVSTYTSVLFLYRAAILRFVEVWPVSRKSVRAPGFAIKDSEKLDKDCKVK